MAIVDVISEQLNLNPDILSKYVQNSEKHYSSYFIPKKSGGERRILHPSPLLKSLQYWLSINIFSLLPVSDHAFAYRKGLGIKKNAEYHISGKHILHLDISNFFESITRNHIRLLFDKNKNLLQEKGIVDEDYSFILDTCCYKNSLTIGSVSSPILSNCIMHQVDLEIRHSLPYGMRYSRYADDMIFSYQDFIDVSFVQLISTILKKYGFSINNRKTSFMSEKSRREVTGLILENGKVSVGSKRKKLIKELVYRKMVKNDGDSKVILGYLSFLKDIEPHYFNSIILKYSKFGNVMNKLLMDCRPSNVLTGDDHSLIHFIKQQTKDAYDEAAASGEKPIL